MEQIKPTDCWLLKKDIDLEADDLWSFPIKCLEKKENMVVLTEAEYLADKKKTAEDAFEAGMNYGMDLIHSIEDSGSPTNPNKEEYIKSLLP